VLAMGPDAMQVPSLMDGGHDDRTEWRYTLRFDVHAAGQDIDACEDIVHQILSVLSSGFPFSLDDIHAMDFRDFTFEPPPPQGGTPIWHVSFLADARYRID